MFDSLLIFIVCYIVRELSTEMTASFIYTKNYSLYDYGPAHPMKTLRLRLCYELLEAYKIFQYPGIKIIEPVPADISDVIAIHNEGYIKALKAIRMFPVVLDSRNPRAELQAYIDLYIREGK